MDISIVIAVHNGEKFISRAVRSCLDQSFPRLDFEIIIVNDGSTDRTLDCIAPFKQFYAGLPPFLKVITLEENMGIGYACNKGIEESLGQYVVRVDSDDYIHEKLLEIEFMFLQMNKDFDAVACDYFEVDEDGNTIRRMNVDKRPISSGLMFRKDRLLDIGLYDPDFKLMEDEDLSYRFKKKYTIHRIPLPLYRYCKHGENCTENKIALSEYSDKLMVKHPELKGIALS
uniref:Putative glycosyltransferase n=1 Tax=viral metagenome TaxID=1070528 RepID=A0A6M3IIV9_9ZZZZ